MTAEKGIYSLIGQEACAIDASWESCVRNAGYLFHPSHHRNLAPRARFNGRSGLFLSASELFYGDLSCNAGRGVAPWPHGDPMGMSYDEAWHAQPDGRSREEVFRSIVETLKEQSGGRLSDTEAVASAHGLIAFVRELVSTTAAGGRYDSGAASAIGEKEHE